VSDEEVSSRGTLACLDHSRPDAVIVGEPSTLDLYVAQPGIEWVRIEVEGMATHAANRWRAPVDDGAGTAGGVNAIEKSVVVIEGARRVEREWRTRRRHPLFPAGFNTANLGAVAGGKSGASGEVIVASGPGSVPDLCALDYNLWYYPGERLEEIRGEFEAGVRAACRGDAWLRDHEPRFHWAREGVSGPPAETDARHPLVRSLHAAARLVKPEAAVTGMLAAALLTFYAARGIPGVIFGPGDLAQAHSADEYVELDSLRAATLALALALAASERGGEEADATPKTR
jgi:acetylornithine deacetylase